MLFRSEMEISMLESVKNSFGEFRLMQDSYQIEEFVIKKLLFLENLTNAVRNSKSRKVVRDIEGIIQKEFSQNITIQQIAEEVYMSSSHLQALFKKETGKTINDYITAVRIEKARKLLKDPAIKIYEVANRVGYQDTNYFTKVFKKYVGINPLDYRESIL